MNTDTYSSMAKLLHWGMAILMLGMLSSGFFMGLMEHSPLKLQIFGLHKSFGFLVLFLLGLRIAMRLFNPPPPALPSHAAWEKGLAHIAHWIVYALMIGLPLSGWIMSSAGDFPATFFGLFEMPDLTGKDQALFQDARFTHWLLALGAIAVIGLHMAGAFKHEYIDRDATLRRMTSHNMGKPAVIFLTLILGTLWLVPIALMQMGVKPAPQIQTETRAQIVPETHAIKPSEAWSIIHEESRITFTAEQYGSSFEGTFTQFDGTIIFDPTQLKHASANIEIDLTSIQTGSADRDAQALSQDWFQTDQFPKAVFTANRMTQLGENQYEAQGTLTIKNITQPLSFPFTLQITALENGGQRAEMTAGLTLDRLAYDVGTGQWADGQAIGTDVVITLRVAAEKNQTESDN